MYIPVDVEGWQGFLNSRLLTDEKLGAQFGLEVLRAMRGQLIFITRVNCGDAILYLRFA